MISITFEKRPRSACASSRLWFPFGIPIRRLLRRCNNRRSDNSHAPDLRARSSCAILFKPMVSSLIYAVDNISVILYNDHIRDRREKPCYA